MIVALSVAALLCGCYGDPAGILSDNGASMIDCYVSDFNAHDEEIYVQKFPDSAAAEFMKSNIPAFECPDKELEKTYYFRWWTYRHHVKETPDGYIISEFLPEVGWAGTYNAINCPASHHFAEGRWLRDPQYLDSYARFWCSELGTPRSYSFPISDAVIKFYKVHGDQGLVRDLYPRLKEIYAEWEGDHRGEYGLFWQMDDRDGMEISISGSLSPDCTGYRPTINSYMYADAKALSEMANLLGNEADAALFAAKADTVKSLIDNRLWDPEARFYKVIPRHRDMSFSPAREEIGFVPWMYDIPDEDKTDAWLQLMDPQGFHAPYGPTTAEQRADGFKVDYEGSACQWNGPSWPFATAQTLTGLANCLHRFGEGVISKEDYYDVLSIYSNSHRRILDSGETICWIDENLNPFTGDWLSRTVLATREDYPYYERGKDYNHSTFCDLVISGLVGVQPQTDGSVVIEPLVPEGLWDYFCLTGINVAGRDISVFYDKTGRKYNSGKGFTVLVDGKKAAHSGTYCTKVVLR